MDIIERNVSEQYKEEIEILNKRIEELNERISRKDALLSCYRKFIELKELRIEQLRSFTEHLLASNNELQNTLDKQYKKRKF